MRFLLLLVTLSVTLQAGAQNRQHTWVFRHSNPPQNSTSKVDEIHVGADGHVYLGAACIGNVDTDPGPGDSTVSGTIANNSTLTKLTASGQFQWSRYIGDGGTMTDIMGIGADSQGNVVIGGFTNDSIDLDPGAPVVMQEAGLNRDAYLIALDSAGNYRWGHVIGGNGNNEILGLAMDALGNTIVVGYFTDTMEFNPGGVPTVLIAPPGTDANPFLAKYDPAGQLIWARKFDCPTFGMAKTIAIDPAGNLVTTGMFKGASDFDPSSTGTYTLTGWVGSAQNGDAFICKLTPNGDLIWAVAVGGPDNFFYDTATELCLGPDGAVYVAGHFDGSIDLDPAPGGSYLLTTTSPFTSFVLKLDSMGHFVQAFAIDGSSRTLVKGIALMGNGNLVVGGHHEGSIDLDPGLGTYTQPLVGAINGFVLTVDPSFNFVGGYTMTGSYTRVYAMASDLQGDVLLGGGFVSTVRLDPFNALDTLRGPADTELGFVLSGLDVAVSVSERLPAERLSLSPNPASTRLVVGLPLSLQHEPCDITVLNALGQVLWSRQQLGDASVILEVGDLPGGLYHVRVTDGQRVGYGKFVKQ